MEKESISMLTFGELKPRQKFVHENELFMRLAHEIKLTFLGGSEALINVVSLNSAYLHYFASYVEVIAIEDKGGCD